jgi:hypothetical protein
VQVCLQNGPELGIVSFEDRLEAIDVSLGVDHEGPAVMNEEVGGVT